MFMRDDVPTKDNWAYHHSTRPSPRSNGRVPPVPAVVGAYRARREGFALGAASVLAGMLAVAVLVVAVDRDLNGIWCWERWGR